MAVAPKAKLATFFGMADGDQVGGNDATDSARFWGRMRKLGSTCHVGLPACGLVVQQGVLPNQATVFLQRLTRTEVGVQSNSSAISNRPEVGPARSRARPADAHSSRGVTKRDVTEQNRAQAQLIDQTNALAALRERQQLSRELHDSSGQILALIGLQGQTRQHLLSRGEFSPADERLRRLVEVARAADVDIRESILGLRLAHSEHALFATLGKHLAQFEKSYSIST